MPDDSGVLKGEELKEELINEFLRLTRELEETKQALAETEKEIIARYPDLKFPDHATESVYIIGTRKRFKCDVDLICDTLGCPDDIREILSSNPFAQGKVKHKFPHVTSKGAWWDEESSQIQLRKIPKALMKQEKKESE